MTAVTAGTSKTFTAQVDGSAFVVIAPGGAVGSVIDQNGNTQAIDPNGTRRTFGHLRELQSITVSMQIGNASVELDGWSGGIPITAETNSSGQTVLDDASRAALQFSGVGVIGAYATADLLESAIPASGVQGSLAIVGAASPYDLYESDGSVWRVRGSKSKVQDFGSTSGARAINCAKGAFCALTITGSTTISFTNGPSFNSAIRMTLNITNGGSNITWPGGTRWAGAGVVGSTPTLATTGTDKVVVEISNIAGTTYYDATYIGRVA